MMAMVPFGAHDIGSCKVSVMSKPTQPASTPQRTDKLLQALFAESSLCLFSACQTNRAMALQPTSYLDATIAATPAAQ